jgi:hypothetical protein
MSKQSILFILLFIFVFPISIFASAELVIDGNDNAALNSLPDVGGRFMDVQTFAYRVAAVNNWSLIISSSVTESTREIKGKSIREVMNNYFNDSEFAWCLNNKCLYIASKKNLSDFFEFLPILKKQLLKGKSGAFTGNFTYIELPLLCGFLKSISGVNILPVDDLLHSNIMMRAQNMEWKHLVAAIVCLNRYRMNITDYSVLIGPAPIY